MKKLTLSQEKDALVCGVFAGFAEYLNIDPTWVRLVGALILFSGVGIVPYFIAYWIIPFHPTDIAKE